MNAVAPKLPRGKSGAPDRRAGRGERNSWARYAAALAAAALLLGGAIFYFSSRDDQPSPRIVPPVIKIVKLIPPPPPPPPQPKPPEPKMIEQPKMTTPEVKSEKPDNQPKKAPAKDAKNDEPPGPLSLDAKGVGPGDLFGLGGKPGGSPYGGGGGGGGSQWGWYASIVQSQIQAALGANPKTRKAVAKVKIHLWADSSGRVSRIQLLASTGDAELDAAIRDALTGLALREPPPKDMPMPVVTRITEVKK